jgi:hypothetical protein
VTCNLLSTSTFAVVYFSIDVVEDRALQGVDRQLRPPKALFLLFLLFCAASRPRIATSTIGKKPDSDKHYRNVWGRTS